MTVRPVVRVCICPKWHVGPPHSPECNQLHREAFFASVAQTRAEYQPCSPQPIVAFPAPKLN